MNKGMNVKLSTKLRIIRYRENYLDAWGRLQSWSHKQDFYQFTEHSRLKNALFLTMMWVTDMTYYVLGPYKSIGKRYPHHRCSRVKGLSRTTVRTYPWTRKRRSKWRDVPAQNTTPEAIKQIPELAGYPKQEHIIKTQ